MQVHVPFSLNLSIQLQLPHFSLTYWACQCCIALYRRARNSRLRCNHHHIYRISEVRFSELFCDEYSRKNVLAETHVVIGAILYRAISMIVTPEGIITILAVKSVILSLGTIATACFVSVIPCSVLTVAI